MNDIAQVSTILFPILYADDTNLFLQGKCLNTLPKKMNLELQKIVEWVKCNKLSLYIDKTHYIIFRSSRKCPATTRHLIIDNEILKHVKYTKLLGVIIDEHLNWASHIKTIKCKLARGIGILCKARKVLKLSNLLTLYNSFYSHIFVIASKCGVVHVINTNRHYSKYKKELSGLSIRRPTWLILHRYLKKLLF